MISNVPGGIDEAIANQFLVILISIISNKENSKNNFRGIKVFTEYLKSDPNVFKAFRPNKGILHKINLEPHIMS